MIKVYTSFIYSPAGEVVFYKKADVLVREIASKFNAGGRLSIADIVSIKKQENNCIYFDSINVPFNALVAPFYLIELASKRDERTLLVTRIFMDNHANLAYFFNQGGHNEVEARYALAYAFIQFDKILEDLILERDAILETVLNRLVGEESLLNAIKDIKYEMAEQEEREEQEEPEFGGEN
jgi:hypothetical protein